ncbi:hypothetical protein ACJIZ3_021578 [Penstemon smallii]|uniref:Uncharacterized protein n=1 Tax=Penstemon smallii TaxID=265156 RepID=A0ABD3SLU1_9LAMI
MTLEYWEHVAANIKAVLTENDDQCLEILSLSYNYLPHHLKPCFLYLTVFPEDGVITVSELFTLWVVEGFLKSSSINVKKVAEENLKELIERNLILVEEVKFNGKPQTCKIHDLVRDLCIKEARKEKFFYVFKNYVDFNPEEAKCQRRLVLPTHVIEDKDIEGKFDVIQSMPGNRSIVILGDGTRLKCGSELLRVLIHSNANIEFQKEITKLVNIRMLGITMIPSSISKLWNLQYLYVLNDEEIINLPSDIWNMPQLRYLGVDHATLPPLPIGTEMPCILKNLDTLSKIKKFRCEDEVLVRIPNLRKLKIRYDDEDITDWSYYRLQNLVSMSKLENLCCQFDEICTKTLVANLGFPVSLKKLTLIGCKISWKHMKIIGDLPNLEILLIRYNAFEGPTWETVEDNFKKLECLKISVHGLNEWRVDDANHFPSLRFLQLRNCENLEEIPSSIGEIPTLEIIDVNFCSDGVILLSKIY